MKKRRHQYRTDLDTHHIFWRRKMWNSGKAKELRLFWYCRVKIPREGLHRWIHLEMCRVPVPNDSICEDTIYQLKMLEKAGAIHDTDPLERRLKVLICCMDTGCSPTAEALREQLRLVQTYKPD